MSHTRLIPLLLAASIGLTAAGCGGSDEPATTTQASLPTATDAAPTTPTETSTPTTETTPATSETTPGEATSTATETQSAPATTAAKPATKDPSSVLKDYAKGGKPASAEEAATIRSTMLAFGEAVGKRDVKQVCAMTTGLSEKPDPRAPGLSCESLVQNSGSTNGPSKKEKALIRKAKITVKGDRASIELAAGVPLPFRKIDGRWRVDYGTLSGQTTGNGR